MSTVETATATGRKRAGQSTRPRAAKLAAKAAIRKLKPKRQRRERLDVPAEKRWLDWPEAESVSNLSRNTLRGHVHLFGKKVGVRMIIDRLKLDAWLQSQPDAA
jgi:hypothetical protein